MDQAHRARKQPRLLKHSRAIAGQREQALESRARAGHVMCWVRCAGRKWKGLARARSGPLGRTCQGGPSNGGVRQAFLPVPLPCRCVGMIAAMSGGLACVRVSRLCASVPGCGLGAAGTFRRYCGLYPSLTRANGWIRLTDVCRQEDLRRSLHVSNANFSLPSFPRRCSSEGEMVGIASLVALERNQLQSYNFCLSQGIKRAWLRSAAWCLACDSNAQSIPTSSGRFLALLRTRSPDALQIYRRHKRTGDLPR